MKSRAIKTVVLLLLLVASLAGCASSAERAKRQELAQTHVLLGTTYLQRGQLEVANQELKLALSLEPEDSQANNMMAVLQWRLKEYAKAERLFRKSIDENPANSSAHHNYGAYLCEKGKLDDGMRQFEAAVKDPLYPYVADVYLNMGVCMMKKPAPVAAEKYFREALGINPKMPGALYQMAKLSYDVGRDLPARGFMQRYHEVAGDTPDGLLLAIKIEQTLGNRDAVASYSLLLRNKFPDSPQTAQLQTMMKSWKN